jgi:hypothetical protein
MAESDVRSYVGSNLFVVLGLSRPWDLVLRLRGGDEVDKHLVQQLAR